MVAPVQFTAKHRQTIRDAFANPKVADDLCDKIDGLNLAGTPGAGATNSVGIAGANEVSSQDHTTTLTYTAKDIAMVDGGANGSIGSLLLYTFPEGLIRLIGATIDLAFTCTSGLTTALKFALGSIPAATNDTLNLTKANVVPSTGGTITTGAGTLKGTSQATALVALTDNSGGTADNTLADVEGSYTEATLANNFADLAAKVNAIIALLTLNGNSLQALLDGTTTPAALYLNISAIDANSSANGTVTITGTITFTWAWAGDKV